MNGTKGKVLVALSGGVDSSVTAALLLEKGYDVEALTFIQFEEEGNPQYKAFINSIINDSKDICKVLGIKHRIRNISREFNNIVIDHFVNEYLKGNTPNPCTYCNPRIKWSLLHKESELISADHIATGHYASTRFDRDSKRYLISKGKDDSKDQSYFLWGLKQTDLSKTIFPLSGYTKTEVRSYADRIGLPVHKKPDSQEICFILGKNYHTFLEQSLEKRGISISEGNIVFDNKTIGIHKGYPFYTIGQRKGLGVTHCEPLYVTSIDSKKNSIGVGTKNDLYTSTLKAHSINMIKYEELPNDIQLDVKIRYNDQGSAAICNSKQGGRLEVSFLEPKRAITSGQSVVLYEKNDLVAGAIIE